MIMALDSCKNFVNIYHALRYQSEYNCYNVNIYEELSSVFAKTNSKPALAWVLSQYTCI